MSRPPDAKWQAHVRVHGSEESVTFYSEKEDQAEAAKHIIDLLQPLVGDGFSFSLTKVTD